MFKLIKACLGRFFSLEQKAFLLKVEKEIFMFPAEKERKHSENTFFSNFIFSEYILVNVF